MRAAFSRPDERAPPGCQGAFVRLLIAHASYLADSIRTAWMEGITMLSTKDRMTNRGRGFLLFLMSLALAAFAFAAPRPARACDTIITGSLFVGDTAAVIKTGSVGAVNSVPDATGCDIGVYWAPGSSGSMNGATVSGTLTGTFHGSFGGAAVVVDGASVDVLDSTITAGKAGSVSVGILYVNGANCPAEKLSRCSVEGNTVEGYGKTGIVAKNFGTIVAVDDNAVTGDGPIGTVAQNGIEFGDGAAGVIIGNEVSSNSYTGTDTFATGILIYGGPDYNGFGFNEGSDYTIRLKVLRNQLKNDDVGVFLSNKNTDNDPPSGQSLSSNGATHDVIISNQIFNDQWVCGAGPTFGTCFPSGSPSNSYQTGIMYMGGNQDSIDENLIYGAGYN
jgi:hypothetical protein